MVASSVGVMAEMMVVCLDNVSVVSLAEKMVVLMVV